MRRRIANVFLQNSFYLSIFFHLLFLLSFSFVLTYQPKLKEKEPEPELFIPSYIFSQEIVSTPKQPGSQNMQTQQQEVKTSKDGIETSEKNHSLSDYLTNQYRMMRAYKKIDPVHLIGEKLIDDPLRKLLGIALTARLIYPKVAMELRLRGVVSIELLLHPDGSVTNIKLVKSSREKILDVAALNAVHDMSPVHNVDLYIKAPKLLVVNVIFR